MCLRAKLSKFKTGRNVRLSACTCAHDLPSVQKDKNPLFLKTATLEYRCDSEEQQTADKFPALQERTVLVTGIDTQGSRIKGSRAENMETLDDRRE